MARVERQISISAPAERVFTYVADFPRHGEWAGSSLQIEKTSEGPVGAGATFKSVGRQFGRDNHDNLTVKEFVPNEKIVFESVGDAGLLQHHFLLKEEGGTTILAKGLEPLRTAGLFKLLAPIVMAFVAPRGFDGDLERIKAKLEGEATA